MLSCAAMEIIRKENTGLSKNSDKEARTSQMSR